MIMAVRGVDLRLAGPRFWAFPAAMTPTSRPRQLPRPRCFARFCLLAHLGIFGGAFVGFAIISEWRAGAIDRIMVTPAARSALTSPCREAEGRGGANPAMGDLWRCSVAGAVWTFRPVWQRHLSPASIMRTHPANALPLAPAGQLAAIQSAIDSAMPVLTY